MLVGMKLRFALPKLGRTSGNKNVSGASRGPSGSMDMEKPTPEDEAALESVYAALAADLAPETPLRAPPVAQAQRQAENPKLAERPDPKPAADPTPLVIEEPEVKDPEVALAAQVSKTVKAGPRGSKREPRKLSRVEMAAVMSLAPIPFLALAAIFGGVFSFLALVAMIVMIFVADTVAAATQKPDAASAQSAERLLTTLAAAHGLLLLLAGFSLAGGTGLGFWSWLMTFFSFGLYFAKISGSAAHQLIHRKAPRSALAGTWIYISMLYGHQNSAHRLVHHRYAATPDDPSTAQPGEGFWDFALRAWPGAFMAGYEIEQEVMKPRLGSARGRLHPYILYLGGGAAVFLTMAVLFSLDGILAYLLLCAFVQLLWLLSDYVQHYGLQRQKLENGRTEPFDIRHGWEAPQALAAMLGGGQRITSDHIAYPAKSHHNDGADGLRHAPVLPWPQPVMSAIALYPTAWRKMMDRRLSAVRNGATANRPRRVTPRANAQGA